MLNDTGHAAGYEQKPGRYYQVLAFLHTHPGATLNDVAAGLNVTRGRAQLCLRQAARDGIVARQRRGDNHRNPWQWSIAGGVRVPRQEEWRCTECYSSHFQIIKRYQGDQFTGLVARCSNCGIERMIVA
jgi:predicted transcriptional regulator